MSRDLDEQLDEMGPEYRAVVARLRAAREAAQGIRDQGSGIRGWLIAASLILFVGLGVFFQSSRTSQTSRTSHTSCIRVPREYRASVPEMIATQNPDGSWKNDFLTRRNAAALRASSDPAAQIAYKKAIRNLRTRGVL